MNRFELTIYGPKIQHSRTTRSLLDPEQPWMKGMKQEAPSGCNRTMYPYRQCEYISHHKSVLWDSESFAKNNISDSTKSYLRRVLAKSDTLVNGQRISL